MVQIRRMQVEDVGYVREIITQKKDEFSVSDVSYGWAEEQLERWVNNKDDVLLVAEDQGKIVGFVTSQYHKPTGKVTIENIYVVEEQRRKDIGTNLMKECLKQLKEKGASYVCGMVKTDNQGTIEFLEKQGFNRGYDFAWIEYIL